MTQDTRCAAPAGLAAELWLVVHISHPLGPGRPSGGQPPQLWTRQVVSAANRDSAAGSGTPGGGLKRTAHHLATHPPGVRGETPDIPVTRHGRHWRSHAA